MADIAELKKTLTSKIGDWIKPQGIDSKAVEWLEDMGRFLADDTARDGLKTTQLRKFFGVLKTIQAGIDYQSKTFDRQGLSLLSVNLAYAVGRETKSTRLTYFREIFDIIKAKVADVDTFLQMVKLIEGIVAYHKFHGGKDK